MLQNKVMHCKGPEIITPLDTVTATCIHGTKHSLNYELFYGNIAVQRARFAKKQLRPISQ